MRLFGTDGIRGRAGVFPLDRPTLERIGDLLGRRLVRRDGRRRVEVVLGGDTRESTPAIARALSEGLRTAGVSVRSAGVITTPAVAFLAKDLGAAAGISISASHNPWPDNGVKIFGPDGRKWPDEEEESLEAELESDPFSAEARATPIPQRREPDTGGQLAQAEPELAAAYLAHLARFAGRSLEAMEVALDLGNGAASRLGVLAFAQSGARVSALAAEPNGRNINENCGALHPANLSARVAAEGSALGAAFDGDADRAILCDETGRVLDGDDVLYILATDWRRRGILEPAVVTGTVMTNFGLERTLREIGVRLQRTPVGDRFIARAMASTRSPLGGEPSGHVILGNYATTGDGILTALAVAKLVAESGGPLSRIATLRKTPQRLLNVTVARRVPVAEVPTLARAVAEAERRLNGIGRLVVRYSGTEPLLRIMAEAEDPRLVDDVVDSIAAAAAETLGAA
jgi:phosphoglucosamine mutase